MWLKFVALLERMFGNRWVRELSWADTGIVVRVLGSIRLSSSTS